MFTFQFLKYIFFSFNNITAIGGSKNGSNEQIPEEKHSNFWDQADNNEFFMKLSNDPKHRRNSSGNLKYSMR